MIRLTKDRVLEDFFIDDNGVITNKEGEVQKTYYLSGRPHFKKIAVHKIQMWTKYDWRDTKIWAIHHIDMNPLNNSIDNLVFLTISEHMRLHKKGKKLSKECKRKISESLKGNTVIKGRIWMNNGVINKMVYPNESPEGFVKGRLKCQQ